jgi:hypothetical protein
MESNYKKLESNSGVLKSNYRTLEFDFSNALLGNGYTKHYIIDNNGQITQTLAYMPWGEDWGSVIIVKD